MLIRLIFTHSLSIYPVHSGWNPLKNFILAGAARLLATWILVGFLPAKSDPLEAKTEFVNEDDDNLLV